MRISYEVNEWQYFTMGFKATNPVRRGNSITLFTFLQKNSSIKYLL